MAKESQSTLVGNMVGDTINNARYIVDFLQETMATNSEDALSEQASVGLFNILGMVADTLIEANKQIDAERKEHRTQLELFKEQIAILEREKKEPPKRKGVNRG